MTIDKKVRASAERFIVRGQVRQAGGKALPGLIVKAYDKDMRRRKLLGRATTDNEGRYEITYTARQFCRAEKGSADLLVSVLDENNKQLVSSDVLVNAPIEAVIDLTLPSESERRSEFELLVNTIQPLLKGQGKGRKDLSIAELKEEDIIFLSEETGQLKELITLLVVSVKASLAAPAFSSQICPSDIRKSDRYAVPAEVFYGWFRQGLPLDRNSLLERPTVDLIAELRKSIKANIVPHVLSDRLDELEATLNRLRAARALEPAPEGKPSSLGDLLGTLPGKEALSDNQRLTFAKLHDEHGDTDDLWTQAKAAGLSKAIPALKRTLALDKLTAGHASLVHALQTKSDAKHPESVEFLTTLEPTGWIELVFEHGVPPGSGLDRDRYIEQLQADVEGKFPLQTLSKQLEKKLSESESFPTRKVLNFLKANPDFDFKTQHVESYLNETDNRDDPLRKGLLQVQRIHVLTSNARETGVLLDAGFGSATQMISGGKPAFELKVSGQLSPERAGELFAAAEYVVST